MGKGRAIAMYQVTYLAPQGSFAIEKEFTNPYSGALKQKS